MIFVVERASTLLGQTDTQRPQPLQITSLIVTLPFAIQNRVKKAVESMTGFKVEEVNVHVQGVRTEKEENNNEESEEQKGE